MDNIIGYVKKWGKYTFSEKPFNEVDSLVLCQLVYLNYEKYVPALSEKNTSVSMLSICEDPGWEQILEDYWYKEHNRELFLLAAGSPRFGHMKMNYYVNVIDEDRQAQFSAMTYFLSDGRIYIAYRGTDATIVGWKEDLNLAFSKPLRSQYLAVEYMEQVAGEAAGGFCPGIYAGGHSKGGNLAVYGAMNCSDEIRAKLIRIFNHDGPGFRPEIKAQGNFQAIAERIIKFIPRSSLVGMILEEESDYEVIESWGIGLFQHNTYSWKVEDGALVRAKNRTNAKVIRDAALNEWILSLTEEQTHAFVDTLYEVVSASEVSNVFEFEANWKKCLQNVLLAAKEVDEETKKGIQKTIHLFFQILLENLKMGGWPWQEQ
ncbi:Mbeg1-like protein [Parablautia intestinalis]|uniref:Mbeg1-like protein n=1 Tax=Parablautia intestinalis TaxID=2320100 RepID=UPI00256F0963|nr:Mbeg1-like protein [Parablautia intestinalis]